MFSENQKVRVDASRVPWDETTIGTVESVSNSSFLGSKLYLVRLENGDLVKCLDEDLEEVKEKDIESVEEEKDVKSITITITREDFDKVAKSGICADTLLAEIDNPLLAWNVTPALIKCILVLREALFEQYKDND